MKKRIIVDGKETNYEIYDDGRCFNIKRKHFLSGSVKNTGYQMVLLSLEGKKKDFSVHRLVAEAFLPNPNNLPFVNHKDGNKLNNAVSNLEWISPKDNTIHAAQNNLIAKRGSSSKFIADLDEEKWVKYLDTNYSISSLGRLRNDSNKNLLSGYKTQEGYIRCSLRVNGKTETVFLHRLVYFGFHPTEELKVNYVVNHKDGNKSNNKLDNLEYVSQRENMIHSQRILKSKVVKACSQFSLNGELLNTYPTLSDAAEAVGGCNSGISQACSGKIKTYKGYKWKYQ